MKNIKLVILVLFISLLSNNVYAQELCSKNGYTVATINGIFTDEAGAILNRNALKFKLSAPYNNQKITVDYIYNSTHLAGFGDLVDSVRQGLFDPKSDYDLVEMLDDASDKVSTQKLLIVGHSQGNFYANSFYNKLVNKDGGVPAQSMGVYSVATPDKYVAGGGKYLTSDTDSVIAATVGRLKNIMKPNTHIELQKIDGNGHSFSDVYLKYRSERIVSDIKSSLDKLKINNIQSTQSLCISPQKITTLHKVTGVVLAAEDFAVGSAVKVTSYVYNTINNNAKSLAGSFVKLAKSSLALVGLSSNNKEVIASAEEPLSETIEQEQPKEEVAVDIPKTEESIVIPENVILPEELKDTPDVPAISDDENIRNSRSSSSNQNPVVVETTPVVDTVDPVITLNGESILTNNINIPYVDGGAKCLDDIDGVISVISTGDVDVTKVGTYIITYSATDKAGNTASPVTRTVNIVDVPVIDTMAPVITLNGESVVYVELNSSYEESGATAFDNKDGIVEVALSGTVDTSNLGVYTITYKATDLALNVGTLNRTVHVINSNPVLSETSKIEFPVTGVYKIDGLEPHNGRKDITQFIFNVIYTDSDNKSPQSVKMHTKNSATGLYLPDIDLVKVADGLDIFSDSNYANGELYELKTVLDGGDYLYSFTAYDSKGNYSKINENDIQKLHVALSSYFYLPKYTFGAENGDGNDWQVWSFNGSNIYDWSDVYVNKYLREHFKMQIYPIQATCSNCLIRGTFNHNPKIGYEFSDVTISYLEHTPQNKQNGITYHVVIQWDPMGYYYYIYHGDILDSSGHTNVPNMNNNLWVGWTGSYSYFKLFSKGTWQGDHVPYSPDGRTGGSNMTVMPYPVYDIEAPNSVPSPIPSPVIVPDPIPVPSSEKVITAFKFGSLSPAVDGVIDNSAHTINLKVPYDTDVKILVPTILVSDKASINPLSLSPQDFTNPIVYRVKAEDNSTQIYTVSVEIGANPNPVVPPVPNTDNDLPTIVSYTINGSQNNVTLNPLVTPVTIIVTANKNVDWKSIQIESEFDEDLDKTFLNSGDCVDGTKICKTKPWDGTVPNRLLLNGNYKIKVHMVDLLPINSIYNDYNKYLDSTITVIGQSL